MASYIPYQKQRLANGSPIPGIITKFGGREIGVGLSIDGERTGRILLSESPTMQGVNRVLMRKEAGPTKRNIKDKQTHDDNENRMKRDE